MNDDDQFGIIVLLLMVICGFVLFNFAHINLNSSEWKCVEAKIINDDPSKTECITYKRNEADE
jgi:hypothetical protein